MVLNRVDKGQQSVLPTTSQPVAFTKLDDPLTD